MSMSKWKKFGVAAGLSFALIAAGCGGDNAGNNDNANNDGNNNDTETSANYSADVDYTITGIEPGAGITQSTDTALEEYENLSGWEQEVSSTPAMLSELERAIANEEPIVVAGWNPHFMFSQFDLKYLEDPKGSYGGVEIIGTIVREGLQEDMPEAYTVLDRFSWSVEDMELIMFEALDIPFEEAAQNWVDDNRDLVDSWIEGVDTVDGDSIELVKTPWDSERASGHVVKIALEEIGYDVTLTPVDPPIMFQAIATGDGDASVAPWLPVTHGSFYEEHEDSFEDLGQHLEGAKIGMAVPTYMDIDSIEDLEPRE